MNKEKALLALFLYLQHLVTSSTKIKNKKVGNLPTFQIRFLCA
ncbi:hypothetical protein VCJ_002594 [Vibrio metoecus]|nr:hypothetical protein VCJ_002594 [Vibrio metoecus]